MIPKIETASSAEIKSFQEQKLLELLAMSIKILLFTERLFAKKNIDISKIKTIEDLQLLAGYHKRRFAEIQ